MSGVFLDLLRTHRLPEDAARWRDVIADAISQKSRFQYGGDLTSRAGARKFVRRVRGLVEFVAAFVRPK